MSHPIIDVSKSAQMGGLLVAMGGIVLILGLGTALIPSFRAVPGRSRLQNWSMAVWGAAIVLSGVDRIVRSSDAVPTTWLGWTGTLGMGVSLLISFNFRSRSRYAGLWLGLILGSLAGFATLALGGQTDAAERTGLAVGVVVLAFTIVWWKRARRRTAVGAEVR